ncbi:MAG: peptidoglycan DD-metalloendopeptidase family protein [Actinomycetota bacterium]|nr:peptidoglycan DD-metalloendopeptidase family protein [Actinomycetota bacterium]
MNNRERPFAAFVLLAVLVPIRPAAAAVPLSPPVDAAVTVRFDEPENRWAPGHRGIDYDVPAGTRVRAAGRGTVTFAGAVAGRLAVTIAHPGGYETTYSALTEISVYAGQEVSEGTWIGRSGSAHPGGEPGLHLGVKLEGSYVDPELLLVQADVTAALHLAPLVWEPDALMSDGVPAAWRHAGTHAVGCREIAPLAGEPAIPPNDNVAVALAGISSSTDDGIHADMYQHGPEELGYRRVYRFSYAGSDAHDLHSPYARTDTYGDIAVAAERLRELLVRVAKRHPGAEVDLLAHSMGGLVARRFLTTAAKEQRQDLPRVEHLVTFASPHGGASIASLPDRLEEETLTGGLLLDAASAIARTGAPLPDPRSEAVRQLEPGSPFLHELARESVVYGTRALALAIPNDLIVTADRAHWEEAENRVVAPEGLQGHSAIVSSDTAQALAFAFLRDAPASCEGGWDLWGPRLGRAIGMAEQQSYRGLAALEQLTLGRVLKVGQLAPRPGAGGWGHVAGRAVGELLHTGAVEASER